MKRLMKAFIFMLAAAVGFSFLVISLVAAQEYTSGENLTIGVTNATDGSIITAAVCNITISNSSGVLQDHIAMSSAGDGSYFWVIAGIDNSLTEKYLAKANCTVAGNEWTTWAHFNVVDVYSYDKIEDMPQDTWANAARTLTDYNQTDLTANLTQGAYDYGDASWLTATGFSTHSAADVWENPDRNLTFIQFPAAAPVSVDFSASGFFNRTFFYAEITHVLGDTAPETESGMQTYYYQKIVFDIGDIPQNVTNGYLIYWAKKNGNPTGELGITYNSTVETNISVIDVTTLTTDFQKFIIGFDSTNVTGQYVEIIFKGQAGWTVANNVILGTGELIATNSLGSSDTGATWAHLPNELTAALVIEFNQTSFLDQLLAGGISTMDREDVWDTTPRNLTYTNSTGAQEMWEYSPRTLTQNITGNWTNLTASDVWTYATRELTAFTFAVNLTQDAFDIIQTHVWAATTRTLTSYGTLIADIWAYATRTLTNWAEIPELVWNHTHRNSTYVSITNVTQQEQLENVTGGAVTNIYDNSTLNVILPAEAI